MNLGNSLVKAKTQIVLKWSAKFSFMIILLVLAWYGGALSASGVQTYRSEEEQRVIDIYRSTNPAVVFISTKTFTRDPFELFSGNGAAREGSGSGVIVDASRGIILTNLHVIAGADQFDVMLADGRQYDATPIGVDRTYDIAVLKLVNPPNNLTALAYGDSSRLEIGQRVLAIGNPFGLDRTLTTGVISSLDRVVQKENSQMKGLIQTDAAINPGNSGGPLIDMNGRLIGINTAILSNSGDSAGIGFAIPINKIRRILPELMATGRVSRPYFGWELVDIEIGGKTGTMVYKVYANTPAAQASIQPVVRMVGDAFRTGYIRDFNRADLIVKVNGKAVQSKAEIDDIIESIPKGQPIELTLKRGGYAGAERTIEVTPEMR